VATYYVDYANGSDGAAGGTSTPWRTMSKAQTAAGAGDTIKLRGSASNNASWYPTAITLNKALTWEADTGHTPTISGGYNLSGNNYALGGSVPGGLEASMIKVTANDVTLEGNTHPKHRRDGGQLHRPSIHHAKLRRQHDLRGGDHRRRRAGRQH
jgi:hypothetical protein